MRLQSVVYCDKILAQFQLMICNQCLSPFMFRSTPHYMYSDVRPTTVDLCAAFQAMGSCSAVSSNGAASSLAGACRHEEGASQADATAQSKKSKKKNKKRQSATVGVLTDVPQLTNPQSGSALVSVLK